jgi:hypothetical protein
VQGWRALPGPNLRTRWGLPSYLVRGAGTKQNRRGPAITRGSARRLRTSASYPNWYEALSSCFVIVMTIYRPTQVFEHFVERCTEAARQELLQ